MKTVARGLLAKLRSMFTLDWQKTAQARARVQEGGERGAVVTHVDVTELREG